ncbi:hypothetical protein HDU90_004946 [Geranomyces variabilis]|nr:hypothetical protein HDU90_004946 [Geranomyces variabilis]
MQPPTQPSAASHGLPTAAISSCNTPTASGSGWLRSGRNYQTLKIPRMPPHISYPSPHDDDEFVVNDDYDDDDEDWTPTGSRRPYQHEGMYGSVDTAARQILIEGKKFLTLDDLRFPSSGTRIQVTDFGGTSADRVTYNPAWRDV